MKIKKNYLAIAMAGLFGSGLLASPAFADDMKYDHASKHQPFGMELTGDIGVASQYVWRGVAQSIDTVGGNRPAVQGDIGIGIGDFSASMWFSNSYPSPDPQTLNKSVEEFDWTLDYSGSIGDTGLGYSLGGIYYTYLYDSHSNFIETYAGLSFDNEILSPSVTAYYTVKGNTSGFYRTGDVWVDLGLGTSLSGADISSTFSFVSWKQDITKRPVTAGLDKYKSGLSLVTLAISKDIDLSGITVTPSLTATLPVIGKSSDGERYIYGTAAKKEFIAAVNFAY